MSERLVTENENACYANQYHNPSNPKAHYLSTGPELWDQLDGKIDVFIAGSWNGRNHCWNRKIFERTKQGCTSCWSRSSWIPILRLFYSGIMTKPYTYVLEGIGEDFMPSTMNFDCVDDVVRVNDKGML